VYISVRTDLQGRMLRLISYDDGYEPDAAIQNVNKMIEDDIVLAVVGSTGLFSAMTSDCRCQLMTIDDDWWWLVMIGDDFVVVVVLLALGEEQTI
jgi:hypothetical protein